MNPSSGSSERVPRVAGKIIEAEIKISTDASQPLPLACALYAIEGESGIWLCSYYSYNRSVFDYLPQKGAFVDERTLGIAFHSKQLIPPDEYSSALWEQYKKDHAMAYVRHD